MFVQHLHHPQIESTNDWAMAWLREHELNGATLFTTDHQTQGRGQRSRAWMAKKNLDACFSLVVPVKQGWTPQAMNMVVALGTRDALLEFMPRPRVSNHVSIKWPNDLLIHDRQDFKKVSGILIENVWRGSNWTCAVIGVGTNVGSVQAEQNYRATSLCEAWNLQLNPLDFSTSAANAILQRLDGSVDGVTEEYHRALFGLGKEREFVVRGTSRTGRLVGVDEQGLGTFEWSPCSSAMKNPAESIESLPSSEVAWCWP